LVVTYVFAKVTTIEFMPDQIIPITRPSVVNAVPPVQRLGESKFPTEVISLPSKGWFYPESNPLSSGTLELKMMTAKEEDILASQNLFQKKIVFDRLLESVVVNKHIKLDEMLICDRNAAFFAIRRLAYGDKYDVKLSCPRCAEENDVSIDLSKMDNREFNFENYPRGENNFSFVLPNSKVKITFKLLTKKDETAIEEELKGREKVDKEYRKEITTRLFHVITSVDGNGETARIRRFVTEEFLSKDSIEFRKYIRDTMPDINSTFDFVCSKCGAERREEVPIDRSFFWPNG